MYEVLIETSMVGKRDVCQVEREVENDVDFICI